MSAPRSRRLFARRTWLNRDLSARAAISGHVLLEQWTTAKGEARQSISSDLVISDCTRTVTLEFDVYNGGDSALDRREKLARLRKFVADWSAAYERALDTLDEVQP